MNLKIDVFGETDELTGKSLVKSVDWKAFKYVLKC